MSQGEVLDIFIAGVAGEPMQSVQSVQAVQGRGLKGDRKYNAGAIAALGSKDAARQLTLIESESLDALARETSITLQPNESRRNLLTRGIALNHLVGKEFNVGVVRALGIRLCEPCGHLESMTKEGVLKGLIHRGGLRAQVLTEGTIHVGDPIVVSSKPAVPTFQGAH